MHLRMGLFFALFLLTLAAPRIKDQLVQGLTGIRDVKHRHFLESPRQAKHITVVRTIQALDKHRTKRSLFFATGVKICPQENMKEVLSSHRAYYKLRVCQEAIWEAFRIFLDRVPNTEEYRHWTQACQHGSLCLDEVARNFSGTQEHIDMVARRVAEQEKIQQESTELPTAGGTGTDKCEKTPSLLFTNPTETEEIIQIPNFVPEEPTQKEHIVEFSVTVAEPGYGKLLLSDPAGPQYHDITSNLHNMMVRVFKKLPGFKDVRIMGFQLVQQQSDDVSVRYAVVFETTGEHEEDSVATPETGTLVHTNERRLKDMVSQALSEETSLPVDINTLSFEPDPSVSVRKELEATTLNTWLEESTGHSEGFIPSAAAGNVMDITETPDDMTVLSSSDSVAVPLSEADMAAEMPQEEVDESQSSVEVAVDVIAQTPEANIEAEEPGVGDPDETFDVKKTVEAEERTLAAHTEQPAIQGTLHVTETVDTFADYKWVWPPVSRTAATEQPTAEETFDVAKNVDVTEDYVWAWPPVTRTAVTEQPAAEHFTFFPPEEDNVDETLPTVEPEGDEGPTKGVDEEPGGDSTNFVTTVPLDVEPAHVETFTIATQSPTAPSSNHDVIQSEPKGVPSASILPGDTPPVPSKGEATAQEEESLGMDIEISDDDDMQEDVERVEADGTDTADRLDESDDEFDDPSESTAPPTLRHMNTPLMATAEKAKEMVVFFSLRVTNMMFSEDLSNKSSAEYRSLENTFLELNQFSEPSDSPNPGASKSRTGRQRTLASIPLLPYLQSNLSGFKQLEILNFRNGSVVVNSRMRLDEDVPQNVTHTVHCVLENFCNAASKRLDIEIDSRYLDIQSADQADPCRFLACDEFSRCAVNRWTGEAECQCDSGYRAVDGLPCQSICDLQPDYCFNDGRCEVIRGHGVTCRCPVGKYWHYHGDRCTELVTSPVDPTVVLGCLMGSLTLVCAVIGVLVFINRKCFGARKTVTLVNTLAPYAFENTLRVNPVFENDDGVLTQVSSISTTPPSGSGAGSSQTSENQEAFESIEHVDVNIEAISIDAVEWNENKHSMSNRVGNISCGPALAADRSNTDYLIPRQLYTTGPDKLVSEMVDFHHCISHNTEKHIEALEDVATNTKLLCVEGV
ncbi:hypothetical protein DPEC_G00316950 [Dallia pectoralis]|uniref:Uncharacterized protein n=1 Tax=Dallia pectoralis TaxID=75939 RepID=A0ACC2FCX4_DALPE|nr:hypothetical protein DPEC_G00316950 [Dallia pectoralis]